MVEQNHSTVTQAEWYAKTVVRAKQAEWEALREVLVYSFKPQPESGQGLLSDTATSEVKASLSTMQMFKVSFLSGYDHALVPLSSVGLDRSRRRGKHVSPSR